MIVGIPKETYPSERRVAGIPETVEKLRGQGFEVWIEAEAGAAASFSNAAYVEAGAKVVDTATLWSGVDLLLKVRAPSLDEVALAREGLHIISFLDPTKGEALLKAMAARKLTMLAMNCIPRISRAQKMDALSSMANIAGYRAVLEAANAFNSFFTGQMTAAGKVPPAKVLIIGTGVAGLAALGAARGLGAIVRAFDTRAAAREQVESLGAEFLEVKFEESGDGGGGYAKLMSPEFIEAEMALFDAQAAEVDIVITTALIPCRPAPKLWLKRHIEAMKPGSVLVDLAAEGGGNCEYTVPGEVVVEHGVTIIGYTDLTSRMANVASQLYGTNLCHLLSDMGEAAGYTIDYDDEVVRGALVLHEGTMTWPPPKPEPKPEPEAQPEPEPEAPVTEVAQTEPTADEAPAAEKKSWIGAIVGVALLAGWFTLRFTVGDDAASPEAMAFLQHLTVFVLAIFVGWQVVWNVTAALHTPLMSVTNAISGIIIVGGMLQAKGDPLSAASVLGVIAALLAMINVAGGFLVTQRMLRMFQK